MTQTNMELEELMANRDLLTKLSYTDDQPSHIPCRPSRKPNSLPNRIPDCVPNRGLDYNPIRNTEFFGGNNRHMEYIPNRTLDWEDSNLLTPTTHTSTLSMHKHSPVLSTRTIDDKSDDDQTLPPPPPPIIYVPEGYGCKMPKRLKKLLNILKNLFLFLYIFGMPVILYQLQTRLQMTRRRIEILNRQIPTNSSPSISASKMKQKKSEGENPVATSLAIADREVNYHELSIFQKKTFNHLRHIRQLVAEKERRLDMVETLSRLLKENPNYVNEVYRRNCDQCCKSSCEGNNSPSSRDSREIFVKTYTRWGKKSCPNHQNTSTLYSGIIVGMSNLRWSTGANYLCLHNSSPQSVKEKIQVDFSHVQSMYSTLLDRSGIYDNFQNVSITPGFHQTLCAVCQISYRYEVIMFPGTTKCPVGWTREYGGFLSGQMRRKRRTEFLCIDEAPDTKKQAIQPLQSLRALTTLNFVESKCMGRPCMEKMKSGKDYIRNAELACVVCSR